MIRFIFLVPLIALAFSFTGKKELKFTVEKPPVSNHELEDTLKINDLTFADFFSPNGDGYNDHFIILNVLNYPTNYLKVFNRWGETVYYASPYLNLWDGRSNQPNAMLGEECSTGVYYFEFNDGNGNIASGKITLKR
ncbi:gliding motility-associated C-terminal domain-containing protein [Fluviicola sp.]|uniref:T9SS type B sorting domain-containing protein n=1 Tax=Fluviicola sp. TaxID=1917219 RepID=UPI0031E132B9